MKTEYFECSCSSAEHTLRFVIDEEDVYTEVHLTTKAWYKRIWTAIKYIFGFASRYGCYDCTLIKPEDYDRFIDLFTKAKETHNNERTTD